MSRRGGDFKVLREILKRAGKGAATRATIPGTTTSTMAPNDAESAATHDVNLDDANFNGLRVLSLESRHAGEMARLIERWGGVATVVPSMREIALPRNPHLLLFENALREQALDITVWTTGVGTRMMIDQIAPRFDSPTLSHLINRTIVVARGPKPVGALREIGVAASIVVPHPNTWREVLSVFERRRSARTSPATQTPQNLAREVLLARNGDAPLAASLVAASLTDVRAADVRAADAPLIGVENSLVPIAGKHLALQEPGVPNRALARELTARGARVMRVPVYRWSLPEDVAPLLRAMQGVIEGRFDVVLWTTGTQVWHVFKLAYKKGMEEELRDAFNRLVIASVGPATTEALREFELAADLEPEHPKMGYLVKEAASRAHALLQLKRDSRPA